MKFPKAPPELIALFDEVQPRVGGARRLMFGYPCAFENGQLFAGLFGDGVFVRVGDADREKLVAAGATPLAPMGRPSKTSLLLPKAVLADKKQLASWLRRALLHARALPPKAKKKPKA